MLDDDLDVLVCLSFLLLSQPLRLFDGLEVWTLVDRGFRDQVVVWDIQQLYLLTLRFAQNSLSELLLRTFGIWRLWHRIWHSCNFGPRWLFYRGLSSISIDFHFVVLRVGGRVDPALGLRPRNDFLRTEHWQLVFLARPYKCLIRVHLVSIELQVSILELSRAILGV